MSKYVLVETISQFRMRYVVEVPDDHMEREYPCPAIQWAEDSVTCEEVREFSQKHIGELILSSHEITPEHIITLCDEDNHYCASWDNDRKMRTFVTEVGYKKEK